MMRRCLFGWLLLLASLLGAPVAAQMPYAPTGDLILVLGAVPQEIPPYVEALRDREQKSVGNVAYWTGTIEGKPVAVALTGIGKVKAATVTTLLVTTLKPRLVLMSGTGSRPNPAVRTGDVIIASDLYEHDAGSLTRNDMVYSDPIEHFQPSAALLAIADRAAATYEKPDLEANGSTYRITVRKGVVATSDLFGVTEARIQTLRNRFHADIMEMESSAFAYSCQSLGVPWLVIRAGSNVSQEAPSDDYKRLGPIAATQAALFGLRLIRFL